MAIGTHLHTLSEEPWKSLPKSLKQSLLNKGAGKDVGASEIKGRLNVHNIACMVYWTSQGHPNWPASTLPVCNFSKLSVTFPPK